MLKIALSGPELGIADNCRLQEKQTKQKCHFQIRVPVFWDFLFLFSRNLRKRAKLTAL